MSSDPEEFDPTRVLDGWCASQDDGLPELDLGEVVGRARRAALDPERVERLQRLGFDMQEVEDLDIRPARPQQMLETPSHEPSPRLLEQWQAGCWSAAARRILIGRGEALPDSNSRKAESHEPHWLLAVWPPQTNAAPHLSRWPEHVLLVTAQNSLLAAEQLLERLPEGSLLWLGQQDIDWTLAAEVLLQHEPALSPFLAQVLRDFSAIERLALSKRIHKAYEPAAPGQLLRRRKSES